MKGPGKPLVWLSIAPDEAEQALHHHLAYQVQLLFSLFEAVRKPEGTRTFSHVLPLVPWWRLNQGL